MHFINIILILYMIAFYPKVSLSDTQNIQLECLYHKHCTCSIKHGNYNDIICMGTNSFISIGYFPSHLFFNCYNVMSTNFMELIPYLRIGEIKDIFLRDCPFPENLSIADIPYRLGVTNYKKINIFAESFEVNIMKQHLSNFLGLRNLTLDAATLTNVPADLFADESLTILTELKIVLNPPELLEQNKNLTSISFKNLKAPFRNLSPKLFAGLPNLITLYLQSGLKLSLVPDHELITLPEELFKSQLSLEVLNLQYNGLNYLPGNLFQHNTNLTQLSLSNNFLSYLPDDLFANTKNLVKLEINNNHLIKISSYNFLHLESLNILDLSNNNLTFENLKLDKTFKSFVYLKQISLAHNSIDRIPVNIPNFLSILDLSYNNMTIFYYKEFFRLPGSIKISLAYNQIAGINFNDHLEPFDYLFRYNQQIYFKGNQLRCDCNLIDITKIGKRNELLQKAYDLKCEEPISLRGKSFESLNPMELLCELPTAQCPTGCNCKIRSYDQIIIVNCSNAQLTSVPDLKDIQLKNFTGIELHLENNYIEELPLSDTIGYANVTALFVASNNIADIESSQLPINLKYLDITRNLLKTFNIQILDFIKESKFLQHVSLSENPWICDCNAKLLINFSERYLQLFSDISNLQCAEPKSLKDNKVMQLDPIRLFCHSNIIKCPKECHCTTRSHDEILTVNCSNAQLKSMPLLQLIGITNLNGIELNLENNCLKELPLSKTIGYANVTKLLLAGNNLENIKSSQLPVNLKELDLRRNQFETLNNDTLSFLNESKFLKKVFLSDNSWRCDCDAKDLFRFTQSNSLTLTDFSNMTCANTTELKYFYEFHDYCPDVKEIYIILSIIVFVICLLISSLVALYYKYQEEVKIFLYAHNICLRCITEVELDKYKKYDAFVSYSHKDEDFINDYLIPNLENGSPAFKLCIAERDWLLGECIPDKINESINDSRRTIVVLSQNFIESVWAKMEFKRAHQSGLNEGRMRVIVIIYGDIEDLDKLDEDIKLYLKMNIYLKWGHPRFWDKLRYAMPHNIRKRNDVELIPLHEIVNYN